MTFYCSSNANTRGLIRLLLATLLLCICIQSTAADKINLNQADAAALESISGIGPVKAQEIIRYREENGPFEYWDELLEISGIGEKGLEKIRKQGSLTGGVSRLKSEPKEVKAKTKKKKKKKSASKPEKQESVTIPGYRYEDIPTGSRM
ncbi:MAG: helix-hairpin-helix domain-containing protein [Pseudomonadota bacterium]|nr:helix-hairpin-helix domain-containing protein [Pseudomonadota bacterium]